MQLNYVHADGFASYIASIPQERPMRCNSKILTNLLTQQWKRLTRNDLEATRYVKSKIALLIEQKYGVHRQLTENYLSNLERTLPLSA